MKGVVAMLTRLCAVNHIPSPTMMGKKPLKLQ
jgi:hypothetical protein